MCIMPIGSGLLDGYRRPRTLSLLLSESILHDIAIVLNEALATPET